MDFDEKVKNILERIKTRSTATGELEDLAELLVQLKKSETTKKYIKYIEILADEVEVEWENSHKEAYIWLTEKLKVLKGSRWANSALVKEKIGDAENILHFKSGSHANSFFVEALFAVKAVGDAVAQFGLDDLFEGWAIIKSFEVSIPELNSGILLDDIEELALRLGHGVSHGEVKTRLQGQSEGEINTALHRGYVSEYVFPKCFKTVYPEYQEDFVQEHHAWLASVEKDPVRLFRLLRVLAEHGRKEPSKMSPITQDYTIDKVISDLRLAENGLFASSFSEENKDKHFMSPHERHSIVNGFLSYLMGDLLDSVSKKKRKSRDAPSVKHAEIVKNWMLPRWQVDPQISVCSMVDAAIRHDHGFDVTYQRSTYVTWAKAIDPWPEAVKRRRPKLSNV